MAGGDDTRKAVIADHISAGGKYRGTFLCPTFVLQANKLLSLGVIRAVGFFESKLARGTGFLIRPDVFVTAGHFAFDWKHSLGRVHGVNAFIGYRGRDMTEEPNVQMRKAVRIAVPGCQDLGPDKLYSTLRSMTSRSSICAFLAVA
jgi:hypothetical protein